ncbi:TPA: hypothetical protein HA219_01610 [Candidatus Woesearchaeota archaeon]|nr:hypothetical protein [Candidatus Woesearchaeota archaeon]HIH39402.1 hypothetical protein [Candidatus Woesearchaeota archaeon]
MKKREVWTILLVLISFIYVYAQGEGEAGVHEVRIVRVEPLSQIVYDQTLTRLTSNTAVTQQQADDYFEQTGTRLRISDNPITPPEVIAAFQRMNPSANRNYFNPNNPNDAAALASLSNVFTPQSQTYVVSAGNIHRDFIDMQEVVAPEGSGIYGYYYTTDTTPGSDTIVEVSKFGADGPVDDQTRSIVAGVLEAAHNVDSAIIPLGPVTNTGAASPTGSACPLQTGTTP